MKKAAPRRRAGTFSDSIREAIGRQPSAAHVARLAGISPSVVLRFLAYQRGLTTDTLDKLADALGLRVVETRRTRTASRTATTTEAPAAPD